MARKSRIFLENIPQYVTLHVDKEKKMFLEEEDYYFLIELLKQMVLECEVAVHAYILLPHGVEFLLTPKDSLALPKFMQLLARRYVSYFNKKYEHTGTLWDRRYSSVFVDCDFIYDVVKFIETKSLDIVDYEERYKFSSIRDSLGDERDPIITSYKDFSSELYKKNYSKLLPLKTWEFIEMSLEKQSPIGSSNFFTMLEEKTGVCFYPREKGRPKKNTIKRNNMYKNLVVLNKDKHKGLKLSPITNLLFAKDLKAVTLVKDEVKLIAKNYPIVFSQGEFPTIMGLIALGDQNVAITGEGQWLGEYIPAMLRKYPFTIAHVDNESYNSVVMIDEDASILSKSKGKQLFKKSGEPSELLVDSINFAKEFTFAMADAQTLVKEIRDSGILEPQTIYVQEGENKHPVISGFEIVNQEKLKDLDKKTIQKWHDNGTMDLINLHLQSLNKIKFLFELAKNRQV